MKAERVQAKKEKEKKRKDPGLNNRYGSFCTHIRPVNLQLSQESYFLTKGIRASKCICPGIQKKKAHDSSYTVLVKHKAVGMTAPKAKRSLSGHEEKKKPIGTGEIAQSKGHFP